MKMGLHDQFWDVAEPQPSRNIGFHAVNTATILTTPTRTLYLIKVCSDHTVQYPLAVSTVHHHESVEFVLRQRVREIEFLHIWKFWKDSTGLVLCSIISMSLEGTGHK